MSSSRLFYGGLLVCAGFVTFTAWDQAHWWALKEDYGFGWLVPLFVGYVVFERRHLIAARCGAEVRALTDAKSSSRWFAYMGRAAAGLGLLAGTLLFLLGAWHRAAAGSSFNGTLAITLGTAVTVLAVVYLLTPTAAPTPPERHRDRILMVGLFVFPALVWLVSAPMLAIVENNLNVFLMRQVTTVVFSIFDQLGFSLEQRGNILVLPSGNVGVAEACSGIRSLTGCLFSGSFLAAIYLRSPIAKFVLILASLLFAFGANLLRSVFLTTWAYRYGAAAIEGPVHDISGYAVLGLTVVGLLICLPWLDGQGGRAKVTRAG